MFAMWQQGNINKFKIKSGFLDVVHDCGENDCSHGTHKL
jgi:hypothetical protein